MALFARSGGILDNWYLSYHIAKRHNIIIGVPMCHSLDTYLLRAFTKEKHTRNWPQKFFHDTGNTAAATKKTKRKKKERTKKKEKAKAAATAPAAGSKAPTALLKPQISVT